MKNRLIIAAVLISFCACVFPMHAMAQAGQVQANGIAIAAGCSIDANNAAKAKTGK